MYVLLLFVAYFALAASVIFVTSKASNHIDEIDAKTNLGSAVLGGILLAAVTSLPELVTSIVSSLGIGMESAEPGLALGNIFGSNLFNIMILGAVDLFFIRKNYLLNVDKGNRGASKYVLAMYLVIFIPVVLFNFILGMDEIFLITNFSMSILSFLIIGIYVLNAIKSKDSNKEEETELKEVQPIKQNIIYFTLWSLAIVVISIFITIVTGKINDELNLGATFAGAIFLGVATSLPEFTAVVTLVKLKNYASAIGNIVGSCLFNIVILSVVDLVTPTNIFGILFVNSGNMLEVKENALFLLILGLISVLILMYMFTRKVVKKKWVYVLPSILVVFNYILYIILSTI